MKIALISDIHHGEHRASPVFLAMQINWFKNEFLPTCIREGVDYIYILGDVFDNRKALDVNVLNEIVDLYRGISSIIPIVAITGNHDVYFKDGNEINSLKLLASDRFKVYTKPEVVQIGNFSVALVPWVPNKVDPSEWLLDADICFGHFEINGYSVSKGNIYDYGKLTPKHFEKYKLIETGHFHEESDAFNIHYLNSPFAFDRSDIGSKKCWHILDMETLERTRILCDDIFKFEAISYPYSGEFNFQKSFLDVIVEKTYLSSKGYHEFLEKLNQSNPLSVSIIATSKAVTVDDTAIPKNLSIENTIPEYIDSTNLEDDIKKRMYDEYQTLLKLRSEGN